MPGVLPTIAGSGARAISTMAAPALLPINNAMSVLMNPTRSMDLPPGLSIAGSFLSDSASAIGGAMSGVISGKRAPKPGTMMNALRGMGKGKPDNAVEEISDNTEKSADIMEKYLPELGGISPLVGSIESLVLQLENLIEVLRPKGKLAKKGKSAAKAASGFLGATGRKLSGFFGQSEEDKMEAERSKGEGEPEQLSFDFDKKEEKSGGFLGDLLKGLTLAGLGMKLKSLSGTILKFFLGIPGLILKGLKFVFIEGITLMARGLMTALRVLFSPRALIRGIGRVLGAMNPILLIGTAIWQFFDGFFNEFFSPEGTLWSSIWAGFVEIFDFFTFGLFGDKEKMVEFGRQIPDKIEEWWGSLMVSLDSLGEWLSTTWTELTTDFKSWWENFSFTELLDKMWTSVTTWFENENQGYAKLGHYLIPKIQLLGEVIGNWVSGVIDDFMLGAANAGKDLAALLNNAFHVPMALLGQKIQNAGLAMEQEAGVSSWPLSTVLDKIGAKLVSIGSGIMSNHADKIVDRSAPMRPSTSTDPGSLRASPGSEGGSSDMGYDVPIQSYQSNYYSESVNYSPVVPVQHTSAFGE